MFKKSIFFKEIRKELRKNIGMRTKIALITYRVGFYENFICKLKIEKYIIKVIYIFMKILSIILGCTDIPPKATYINWGLRLPHKFDGIKLNPNCSIGRNCTIFHNVTIGATESCKTNISIGDNVYIGAYAIILGNVTIGNNCNIGAGTIIINKNISSNVTVVNDIKYKIILHKNNIE